jgi:pilus assembly protein CpaC
MGKWSGAAVLVLSAAVMLAALPGIVIDDAAAQAMRRDAGALADPGHRAHMAIPPGTRFPIARKITIGLDKSMLIEVPVDLQNVLVSNPEVVDAVVQSSRQVYLLAKDIGDANVFFMGVDGQRLMFLEISITRDLTPLTDALNRLLPGARIKVEAVGENIILIGNVINPVDANRAAEIANRYAKKKDSVVNMLSVGAKEQVLLKVQVAEMQRDAIRRLGVDLPGALASGGNVTFTKVLRNAFPVTGAIVPPASAIAPNALPSVFGGDALQTTWQAGGNSITALVQALERAGLIRTLAEPNLTAISGESAKFHAGGKFPIPMLTGSGNERQVTIQWETFGVQVEFKPVVLSEGRISLRIAADVSELSSDGAVTVSDLSIPALKVRRAETTLELPSGGTLAMAGLLSDQTRQNVEGTPGVKDLPVLGALFRSNDYQRRESELVILVTPYLATHAHKSEFARPDGGFAPSSTLQELLLGHINRIYGPPGYRPTGRYEGDFGFILDYPDGG